MFFRKIRAFRLADAGFVPYMSIHGHDRKPSRPPRRRRTARVGERLLTEPSEAGGSDPPDSMRRRHDSIRRNGSVLGGRRSAPRMSARVLRRDRHGPASFPRGRCHPGDLYRTHVRRHGPAEDRGEDGDHAPDGVHVADRDPSRPARYGCAEAGCLGGDPHRPSRKPVGWNGSVPVTGGHREGVPGRGPAVMMSRKVTWMSRPGGNGGRVKGSGLAPEADPGPVSLTARLPP